MRRDWTVGFLRDEVSLHRRPKTQGFLSFLMDTSLEACPAQSLLLESFEVVVRASTELYVERLLADRRIHQSPPLLRRILVPRRTQRGLRGEKLGFHSRNPQEACGRVNCPSPACWPVWLLKSSLWCSGESNSTTTLELACDERLGSAIGMPLNAMESVGQEEGGAGAMVEAGGPRIPPSSWLITCRWMQSHYPIWLGRKGSSLVQADQGEAGFGLGSGLSLTRAWVSPIRLGSGSGLASGGPSHFQEGLS